MSNTGLRPDEALRLEYRGVTVASMKAPNKDALGRERHQRSEEEAAEEGSGGNPPRRAGNAPLAAQEMCENCWILLALSQLRRIDRPMRAWRNW